MRSFGPFTETDSLPDPPGLEPASPASPRRSLVSAYLNGGAAAAADYLRDTVSNLNALRAANGWSPISSHEVREHLRWLNSTCEVGALTDAELELVYSTFLALV